MASSGKTLIVIGSGPGIGRSVTTLFATKRYSNVALIARREEQLELEKKAVEEAVGAGINVKTYAVDVVDSEALLKALDDIEAQLGKPECIFYNAARILPSELLTHDFKDVEYDFKVSTVSFLGSGVLDASQSFGDRCSCADIRVGQINVSALYTVAQRETPHLIELAKQDDKALPSILVTSSLLPQHPIPQLFALSLVKAAQRNLVQSPSLTYASQGVHPGLINVGGPVSPEHEAWNPTNIAAKAWDWFAKSRAEPTFEVLI